MKQNIKTQFNQQITIQFDCFEKNRMVKPKNFIRRFAYDLKLNIKSFVSLKKKTKQRLTVISGPHVHKKSRQQYRIDSYRAFFTLIVQNKEEYARFLDLKRKLYENYLDEGFEITFKYLKKKKMSTFC